MAALREIVLEKGDLIEEAICWGLEKIWFPCGALRRMHKSVQERVDQMSDA
jgi:hypothetical protein